VSLRKRALQAADAEPTQEHGLADEFRLSPHIFRK